MKLQTSIPISPVIPQIDYDSNMLLLGSCFADHITKKLTYHKFRLSSNPFGILFHSEAIKELLWRSSELKSYTAEELFFLNDTWHSYDAHSDLNHSTKEATLQALNSALEATHKQISKSTHIIITLGTAWVYRHSQTDRIVANCHKVPQREFTKELLSVKRIIRSLEQIIDILKSANQKAIIIFTVSPVRHLKDGFVENARSKAHLVSAVHQLIDGEQYFYFPAYEIIMDELRDYRYYNKDMVHPSEVAIDYIWERFKDVWIKESAFGIMKEVDHIQKGLLHRPFNPQSDKHKQFLKELQSKIAAIQETYPFMEFESV